MKRVRAYGPAGIGNLAAGFDVLGAAVAPAGGGRAEFGSQLCDNLSLVSQNEIEYDAVMEALTRAALGPEVAILERLVE